MVCFIPFRQNLPLDCLFFSDRLANLDSVKVSLAGRVTVRGGTAIRAVLAGLEFVNQNITSFALRDMLCLHYAKLQAQ